MIEKLIFPQKMTMLETFGCQDLVLNLGDWKIWLPKQGIKILVTKIFKHCPKTFDHPMDHGLISTIDQTIDSFIYC
jgi:hypothetical protein